MADHIRIRQGLDIPISGAPAQFIGQDIEPGNIVRQVALNGLDYIGLKPRLLVAEGDEVRIGQALFTDRRDPAVKFAAPASGRIIAINRGARRVLETVVIELADSEDSESFDVNVDDPDSLATSLQASGLWTAFRTRPYSHVPRADSRPRSIFVTAIDTNPLAVDPAILISHKAVAFHRGMQALPQLTNGPVFLCTAQEAGFAVPEVERLQQVGFSGPHPAGLPGTHIHHLDPVSSERTVWHIGYQDVIAIGEFLHSGKLPVDRVVALGGHQLKQPRMVSTRLGASLNDLMADELNGLGRRRMISGSVLNGRNAGGHNAFLGRFHHQVTVIDEGGQRRFLGWSQLFSRDYSTSNILLKSRGQQKTFDYSSARNGRFSGMLPMRIFDGLLPMDILPSPLFRALLVMDTDRAQALGCLELSEEDLALCTFACPAKTDYGGALRANLEHIEKHG